MIGAALALDPDFVALPAAALALVLLVGAAQKLRDFARFRRAVAEYRVLPAPFALPFAVLIVLTELAAAMLLAVPATRPLGALAALALLLTVSASIAVNLLRGRSEIDCGCGGPGQTISWGLVARNAVLALLALAAAVEPTARAFGLADAAMIGAGALIWAGLYLAADQLLANRAAMRRRPAA
ncbi:MAG TPA: MauE/DoxX family redox-associated membrane protein [Stellaceae bacterium]|nr:MauE/DoxX family redox-associated membrane protein [Stellaceae bacterium]